MDLPYLMTMSHRGGRRTDGFANCGIVSTRPKGLRQRGDQPHVRECTSPEILELFAASPSGTCGADGRARLAGCWIEPAAGGDWSDTDCEHRQRDSLGSF